MEAIVQEIDVEKLFPIFNNLRDIWNGKVEVTIKPIDKTFHVNKTTPLEDSSNSMTTAEKIEQFRKKYNRETFVEHLKEQVAKGYTFDFDVQKVINGNETEEEEQGRYRQEKQVWSMAVAEKAGEYN